MDYKDFKEICHKERRDKRTSYAHMFDVLDPIAASGKLVYLYVKDLHLEEEELHIFTDTSLITAKRIANAGENIFKYYPLIVKSISYKQDWNNTRHRSLSLELDEYSFRYDSLFDCNENWRTEYAHEIEELAQILLTK